MGRCTAASNQKSLRTAISSLGGEELGAYITAQGGAYRICWASREFGELGRFSAYFTSCV